MAWQILVLPLLALLSAMSQADVHKCLVDGKMVYTDQECPDDTAINFAPADLVTTAAGEVSYTGAIWLKDSSGYARAIEVGAKENLPVLIYGYTDWCGFCKKLEKTYFNDDRMKETLARFIKVKINPEHSRSDNELFTRLGGTGYPTLFIQHPNRPPQRISDPFVKQKNGQWGEVSPKTYYQIFLPHLQLYEKTTGAAAAK